MGFNSGFKGLNLNFLDEFSKNMQISSFLKIRSVEGLTDEHDVANSRFLAILRTRLGNKVVCTACFG